MNLQNNLETYILMAAVVIPSIGSYLIIRLDWKRYGLLFVLAAVVGNILCYIFVQLGFYSFPFRLFPQISSMPITAISTAFSFTVLLGVRYSPRPWAFKIPFYWAIVHLGMTGETLVLSYTRLIEYELKWDFWDSYTWWWIYFLGFEWIGGKLVPAHLRRPLNAESFRYGNWAWIVFHFILIVTIFLGGVYLGYTLY